MKKKLYVVLSVAALGLIGVGAAQAEPVATVCHDVAIDVNGTPVVNSGCTDLPPE